MPLMGVPGYHDDMGTSEAFSLTGPAIPHEETV